MATLVASRKGLDEPLTPIEHARRIAGLAQEKLAQDVLILDMRPVCSYTDFFVLATGQNPRQIQAISDAVEDTLKKELQERPALVEGIERSEWVLLDYFNFVVHVFSRECRAFYALERLWGNAVRHEFPEDE